MNCRTKISEVFKTSLWMRVDNDSQLSSILAFLKEFNNLQPPSPPKLHKVCWTLFWGYWADKTFTTHCSSYRIQVWVHVWAPADQCRSSGDHSRRLFEKTIEEFDCKINGQALGAALLHSLGGSDGRAQTQGVSKSAAVAVGLNRRATTLRYWLISTVKKV